MTDASEEIAVRALYEEMQRIRARVPVSRWFFFGSITTTKRPVGDIDLLVVCDTSANCTMVRAELASVCAQFPIHLLLMTSSEEMEVKFIQGESAIEITLGQTRGSISWSGRDGHNNHEEQQERLEGRNRRTLSLSSDRCENHRAG